MIVYFADRSMNILGQASTNLPKGLMIVDDLKTEDVETGVAIFECKIPFDDSTREKAEEWATVGNYILRSHGNENEFYTIIDCETDTKKQTVYIYAEDDGMDLINEVVGPYEADQAYPIAHYVNMYVEGSGWEIGINEVEGLTRKLSWTGEATASERILSIASGFDGCDISYSFEINGLQITKKYINIYEKRGKDTGIQLRLNREVDRIVTTKSIANLATALQCAGGTPDDAEEPITLLGYEYDDGDFYVDGSVLKSRKALANWSRYLWRDDESKQAGGHIVKQFSYDTTSQEVLCVNAIAELKQICNAEVNYDIDISNFPENVSIGDRVNIVDDAGELYLSSRVLTLETSAFDQTRRAVLGEHLIRKSGISAKVEKLAAQFAKQTVSVTRAKKIGVNAQKAAEEAQKQANAAVKDAAAAQTKADAATNAANTATQSAATAEAKALAAEAAVNAVESSVASLQTTITNAQTAAENAYRAAQTADEKADEAKQAAANAVVDAAEAKESAETAQTTAESAETKAEEASGTAEQAKADAQAASNTAQAAKLDAEQAKKDIAAFEEQLENVTTTMQADYARKTDLTETEANLQSQITQNAAQISSTVTKVTEIDETANNAADLAQQAQTGAATAQAQADQATADAKAAQDAADAAAAAASSAQSEADAAKAAAATAQSVADKAEADLEAAKADLATVQGRVDATEEEIAAAQQAVNAAQTVADKAQADASKAETKAATAQTAADKAVTNAEAAQTAAANAVSKAEIAQQTADEAKGNAAAAQAKADQAAQTAATAQATANTAKTNADNAQAQANAAAQAAADAQTAADNADAKAAQAASDLATAKQNLENVTSRVGATEAEVEAAQAAVEAAQSAADQAKSEAEAAQETADTAKTNAATAQTAANNAKAAADKAQEDAEAAQAAADKAQADVDALAVTVTAQGTAINQKADRVELEAYKTTVSQTLGGYYTKSETDAAIQVKSDAITSSVNSKISGIQIGGRNLVPVSKIAPGRNVETTESFELRDAWDSPFVTNEDLVSILDPATEYTARYTLELIERTTVPTKFDMMVGFLIYSAAHSTWVSLATQMDENAEIGAKKTYQVTFTTPAVWNDEAIICYSRRWTTNGTNPVGFDAFKVTDFKIEKGNKATDWTPAPEDVAEGINSAQNTADDANANISEAQTIIQQLADSIASLVQDGNGGSLIKQDANGLYYFNISEIEKNIADANAALDTLEGIVLDANGQIDVLKSTAAALQARTEYVRSYTDENGKPCLELGEGDTTFKVYITNESIQFADGEEIPAYIDRKMLVIEKAMIKNELQFGDDEEEGVTGVWIWKRRANGNFGISWKGVSS